MFNFKSKNSKKILCTADVHIERVLREPNGYLVLHTYFMTKLELVQPQVFIIAGDLVDSKHLRLGTSEALQLQSFLVDVLTYCESKKIEVVVLKGTDSHDGDVVKNLSFVTNKFSNYTYIDKIERKIINGIDIVFIPELLYPTYKEFESDLSKYVTEYNKADIIVFHGMFDFAIDAIKQIDSKHNQSRCVIMDSKKISKLFKYCAIGGHVHTWLHDGDIYYVNRFINERGHSHNKTVYGAKLVILEQDKYNIKNIENEFLIKLQEENINFITDDDDAIRHKMLKHPNMNDSLFKVIINNEQAITKRYNAWIKSYGIKYIERKIIGENTEIQINSFKTKEVHTEDELENMLVEMYNNKFSDKLSDEVLNEIKNGENI